MLPKRVYALGAFFAMMGAALAGTGAFHGKPLGERLAGGIATGLFFAVLVVGWIAVWRWVRARIHAGK